MCEWSSAGVLQSKNKNIISFVIKITKMESLLKVFLTFAFIMNSAHNIEKPGSFDKNHARTRHLLG